VLKVIEKLTVDGREVVQMPVEDYNAIVGFIESEKQKKDDFYRKRIEMAEECLENGGPFISVDELFDYAKEYDRTRRKEAANE
jgi:hypothetical protein